MSQDLTTCIPAIATVVAAADSIKGTQSLPNDIQGEYPFAMVYLLDGEAGNDITQGLIDLVNIAIDILAPTEWSLGTLFPLFNAALDELKVDLVAEVVGSGGHFSNSIDTFAQLRFYFIPEYPFGNIPMLGYRIVMEQVKLVDESIG